MENNYILGGGIAGLIWAFYNKEYKIISTEIGGQYNYSFQLGPRYLEVTKDTQKLLKDLNIITDKKIIKVGYYDNQFIDPDNSFKKKYFKKSRGTNKNISDKTLMNSDKKEMQVFNIDFDKIIHALKIKLFDRIIVGEIAKINLKYKCFFLKNQSNTFCYSKLINTIPLNTFYKITSPEIKKEKLASEDITYILLQNNFFDIKEFNFVYCLNEKFHRITKTEKGLVVEWFGEHTEKECRKEFGMNYINSQILKDVQIITLKKIPSIKNIIFSGRYGTWNRAYKTEKVIKEAIEYAKKNKLG